MEPFKKVTNFKVLHSYILQGISSLYLQATTGLLYAKYQIGQTSVLSYKIAEKVFNTKFRLIKFLKNIYILHQIRRKRVKLNPAVQGQFLLLNFPVNSWLSPLEKECGGTELPESLFMVVTPNMKEACFKRISCQQCPECFIGLIGLDE